MATIQHISGYEILDSRGQPTDGSCELAPEGRRFDAAGFIDHLARWVDAYR